MALLFAHKVCVSMYVCVCGRSFTHSLAPSDLKVNESKMTGESRDIKKNFLHPFLMSGTEVYTGTVYVMYECVHALRVYGAYESMSVLNTYEDVSLSGFGCMSVCICRSVF